MTGEQKPGGLEAIISDEEIVRVHGHANFGPTMTPRDVVNEGVRKYAIGYTSGYTQLTILLEHGLITKPRPGRYDASLTKKGKRYARALGMYHATPAEPAEARIREQAAEIEALTKALSGLTCGGSEFFTRKGDRFVADIPACVEWVQRSRQDAHRRTVEAIKRATAAEAKLADVQDALGLALCILAKNEPGDSRAVSDHYVAMAAAGTPHHNDEGREIIRQTLAALQQEGE